MSTLRAHLRSLSWLALAAMLALALLPSVSHALRFAQGDPLSLAEICTPQGMRTVLVDGAADDNMPATAAAGADCPYCSLCGHLAALPPASPSMLPPMVAQAAVPSLFLQAPRTLFAWASAQPRAPPVLS
jgi:hypothetical protein